MTQTLITYPILTLTRLLTCLVMTCLIFLMRRLAQAGTPRLSQALLKFSDGEDYSDDDSNERSEGEREWMASEEERHETRSGWQFRKLSTL
jgi:hypothetical protein